MSHNRALILRFILLTLVLALTSAAGVSQNTSNTAQSKIVLHLRWAGEEGVLRYRLQLALDEQFRDIVFDRAVYGTEYGVSELGPGRYFWRVAPAVKETGRFTTPRAVEIGEDARTDTGTKTPELVATSNVGWSTTTGSIARPVVAHLRSTSNADVVGVNADGMVYGIDGASGVALWSARFRPNAKRGEPTGNGGAPVLTPILIDGRNGLANLVVAFEGGVRALEGVTGRELWRATLGTRPIYGGMAATDGGQNTVMIASDSSTSLTLLNAATGEVISEVKLDAPAVATPSSFPIADGHALAFALQDGIIDVRNSSGSRIRYIKMDTKITTAPLVVKAPRGTIVVVGTENGLISLGADDLKPMGRIATDGDAPAGLLSSVDLDADGAPEVLMLMRLGRLVVVGSTDGRIKWHTAGSSDAASTAIADLNSDGVLDVVVAAGPDFARGFSGRDGTLLWKAEGDGTSATAPANQSRALVTAMVGDGSGVFVVGTDTGGTGLRAIGLPRNSVKVAKE